MCSNPKAWKLVSFLTALTARGSRLGFPLLLLLALVLGAAYSAQAGTDLCSGYPLVNGSHIIDGNDPTLTPFTLPSSIGIDANCTFENFPISAKWPQGLTSTLNFKSDGFLAIFNNIYYSGNMACATTTTKIWFVNPGAIYAPNNSCQGLFIPVETIAQAVPRSHGQPSACPSRTRSRSRSCMTRPRAPSSTTVGSPNYLRHHHVSRTISPRRVRISPL